MPKLLSLWALRDGLVGPPVVAGVAVLAGMAFFASPAPAGATPYTVATEQLVLQLGQSGLKNTSFAARRPARDRAPSPAGGALVD